MNKFFIFILYALTTHTHMHCCQEERIVAIENGGAISSKPLYEEDLYLWLIAFTPHENNSEDNPIFNRLAVCKNLHSMAATDRRHAIPDKIQDLLAKEIIYLERQMKADGDCTCERSTHLSPESIRKKAIRQETLSAFAIGHQTVDRLHKLLIDESPSGMSNNIFSQLADQPTL